MRVLFLLLFILACVSVRSLHADPPANKRAGVERIVHDAPELDGKLDDDIWRQVTFVDDFRQKDPLEGALPTVRTEVGFAYDDDALYVAARMWIDDPENVSAIVTRRDNSGASDRIIISLDSYLDRRTAYSFSVTAAGVRTDYYHGTDLEYDRDYSFDPVWEAATWIGTTFWTAEMRIPFSQLRFNDVDEQLWGLNMNRYIPKLNEDIYWIVVPKDETGWSSRMGRLAGIRGVAPSARVELLPYAALYARIPSHVDPEDPYLDPVNFDPQAGLDAKIGLGPNMALDIAVNPDFGQVEADPAQVNLSAFETSFGERRPFFVEGAGLFSFNGARHFYSRRIGAQPQQVGVAGGEYVDAPAASTILGAAKLTGRFESGLSVGGIVAATEREYTTVRLENDEELEFESAPFTMYGVGRVQQEFGANASTVGLIGTIVSRDVTEGEPFVAHMADRAVTGGADWRLRFDEGAYQVEGSLAGSHVVGSREAIATLQRSSARYFQRPDADYVELDTNRTELTGYAASLELSRESGDITYSVGGYVESPGYELNDLGILGTADDIEMWGDADYRENDPGSVFRSWNLNLNASSLWNFGGVRQSSTVGGEFSAVWLNYLSNYVGFGITDEGLSDNLTRGGPLMEGADLLFNGWTGMSNYFGAQIRWNWHVGYGLYEYNGSFLNTNAGLSMNLGDRVELSFSPEFYTESNKRQYLGRTANGPELTYGTRYLFGLIDFSRTAMQVRVNYAITPDLSLEFYAEPFVASGDYTRFAELLAAGTGDLDYYDDRISFDDKSNTYTVTFDSGRTYDFSNPDFNVRSFRSNLVMRWEWIPGSTLFLVWQQNQSGFEPHGHPVDPGLWIDAVQDPGDTFLGLKLSYWLPVD